MSKFVVFNSLTFLTHYVAVPTTFACLQLPGHVLCTSQWLASRYADGDQLRTIMNQPRTTFFTKFEECRVSNRELAHRHCIRKHILSYKDNSWAFNGGTEMIYLHFFKFLIILKLIIFYHQNLSNNKFLNFCSKHWT